MKRFFLYVILAVLFCVSPVFAADSGARFSGITGQVEVRPEAVADAWKLAKIETVLNVDDHVKTDEDSSAIIGFEDMTTFVLKSGSEIVVSTPPTQDSKVKLVAGNIWVNVKKMVKDGSMEVEMNQAVAGIKGTNITCASRMDEDRIQVLRGLAEVLIKSSQERIQLKEGEELVIKGGRGTKTEIDVIEESKKWEKELSQLGESIQLDEVPEVIKEILTAEAEQFQGIQDYFKDLSGADKVSEEDALEFAKEAERFIGTLMEDTFILTSLQTKVESTLSGGQLASAQLAQVTGYTKLVSDARQTSAGYQAEIGKMLKTKFKAAGADSSEIEMLVSQVAEISNSNNDIFSELQGNPAGMPGDWFRSAIDTCNENLQALGDLQNQAAALADRYPADLEVQNVMKQISTLMTSISRLMNDLAVVEVDTGTLTEMQQADDQLSDAIVTLREELDSYNATIANSNDAQTRLKASLSVLNNFAKARRLYQNSQRLYDSMMRASSSQKYQSSEQAELSATYERITNTYNQLGIVAEQLQNKLQELENQLGSQLK